MAHCANVWQRFAGSIRRNKEKTHNRCWFSCSCDYCFERLTQNFQVFLSSWQQYKKACPTATHILSPSLNWLWRLLIREAVCHLSQDELFWEQQKPLQDSHASIMELDEWACTDFTKVFSLASEEQRAIISSISFI